MARYVAKHWHGNDNGWTRNDRQTCSYKIFEPDALNGRTLMLDRVTAAEVDDATRKLTELNTRVHAFKDTEALARIALRAESVASSHIEGLRLSPRRLLRSELSQRQGHSADNITAGEIVANLTLMAELVQAQEPGSPLTLKQLLEAHHCLMKNSAHPEQAGIIRTSQNWVGGSSFHPCRAEYVPPDPRQISALLDDLVTFCNQDDWPPIAQAALAHAQFETIHPFADGNGRVGRALVHLILRRRGITTRVTPPISLALATRQTEYIQGLMGTRAAEPAAAEAGQQAWIGQFAGACCRAVQDVLAVEDELGQLQQAWRGRLGRVRARSALDALLQTCIIMPVLTVGDAAGLLGCTYKSANRAIARLLEAKVLTATIVGKRRHRVFEALEVISLLRKMERRMASPAGDTQVALPTRPVPSR